MTTDDEYDQIDAYIVGDDGWDGQYNDDGATPCVIDSRKNASRELRRLARLDRETAEVEAVYRDRLAALDAYRADRTAGIRSRRDWVVTGLEQFMRAEAERSGIKSLTLPDGTLALRKALNRVDGDPAAVPEDWSPFLVRYRPEIDKTEVKARLKPGPVFGDESADHMVRRVAVDVDGQVVAGVWFVTADEPSFTVKLTTEESDGVPPTSVEAGR